MLSERGELATPNPDSYPDLREGDAFGVGTSSSPIGGPRNTDVKLSWLLSAALCRYGVWIRDGAVMAVTGVAAFELPGLAGSGVA